MTLYVEDDYDFFSSQGDLLEKVKSVVEAALQVEDVPYEVEVCLTVVDREEIKSINKEHREIDKATDVLSFPQIQAISNGNIDWEQIDTMSCMNLDTDEIILGDIVLCHEVAKEQAVSYEHSLLREVCFLVAHSMFHLLGYDHMTEADEKLMIEKQNQVLEQLGIMR